jgi:gliding motility-associated-like protein
MQIVKQTLPLLLLLFSCCLYLPPAAAQPGSATIQGPGQICQGACANFLAVGPNGEPASQVVWSTAGIPNPIPGNPALICADAPGILLLTATGVLQQGTPFSASYAVTVSPAADPVIVALSSACTDSSLACERVCAFGSAVYEVSGVPPGTPLNWEVSGAESYSVSGNLLTVNWGAPGQGQLTVETNSSNNAPPLQVHCGMWDFTGLPNGNLGGIGYLSIQGGSPGYSIALSNGYSASGLPGVNLIQNLASGPYTATVTDALGNVQSCSFTIAATDADCWASVYPTALVQPSSCDSCDGSILLEARGLSLSLSFTWNNGSNVKNQSNLCEGIYSLTLTDDLGCSSVETFEIACPPDNTCAGSDQLCVDILDIPQAVPGAIPSAQGGVIQICQGQSVFFQNQSLGASTYRWDFGDQTLSTEFEPQHTYLSPGTYTVALIAWNSCYCSDTSYLTVIVDPAPAPPVNCSATVCEGQVATYTTSPGCSSYEWTLAGNYQVVEGGGPTDDFISVQWISGPEGTVSLTASGCGAGSCSLPNVVHVPVISDVPVIQGPLKVCQGSEETYSIPDYAGTGITWEVAGSGEIIGGQGTERAVVKWTGEPGQGNPQQVIVTYFNCYLGCQGKDTLDVFILPGFYARGPAEICQQDTGFFEGVNALTGNLAEAHWQLLDAAGTVVWSSAASSQTAGIPFNVAPGNYTVRAAAANGNAVCNSTFEIFVKIYGAPPKVAAIQGAADICPGSPYTYSAQGLPGAGFSWTFSGGTPASTSGNPVNVVWGSSPFRLVTVVQTTASGLICTSEADTLAVQELPPLSISGELSACRESDANYTLPAFESLYYDWEISPPDAGTIIAGQGTSGVTVRWHLAGTHQLSASACGQVATLPVEVLALPQPVVPDISLCADQAVTVQTSQPFAAYLWKAADGTAISNLAAPVLNAGFYSVEVVDGQGCQGSTSFLLEEKPIPQVGISTPAYFALCPGSPAVSIFALTTSAGYDYQWSFNGNPTGTNQALISTTNPGIYQVTVTDANGCTAASAPLELADCASLGGICINGECLGLGGGPPVPIPNCIPAGVTGFDVQGTPDCNAFDFVNTSTNAVPGSFTWIFGDPESGPANTSTSQNPSHTFTAPGYYTVVLQGLISALSPPGSACPLGTSADVLVPLGADFNASSACAGEPMSFSDLSVAVAGTGMAGWDWDFGDPASGTSNAAALPNPTHVYNAPGDYAVKLTVTASNGCQSSVVKTVMVHAAPSLALGIQELACEKTAVSFPISPPATVTSLSWDFGDPASGAANASTVANAFHAYQSPGAYEVTLSLTNSHGCSASFSDSIFIAANTLTGFIAMSQPSPICAGDSIVLTAPGGGQSWEWQSGQVTSSLTALVSGLYAVTITDAVGCTFAAPPVQVAVIEAPQALIKAVEFNEFGQPVAIFENNISRCEGDEVTLVVQGSLDYSYIWSNGESGELVSFTAVKNNLLPVGTHDFTVTVTDNASGCTAVAGPFTVTIHPAPDVAIQSAPAGYLCENTQATLSVVGPDPALQYTWNTGEMGTQITTAAAGAYFALAVNQFGCSGRSEPVELHPGPDTDNIPAGCYNRCGKDTMCLPPLPDIVSFQWYFNDNPIPAPAGVQPNLPFEQSGDYYLEMTDSYGCKAVSDLLSLQLTPSVSEVDIIGNVWFDNNDNGIIDAGDTAAPGIGVFLSNGLASLDTATTGNNGAYVFSNLPATVFSLILDSLSLPAGWKPALTNQSFDLAGCSTERRFDWLLLPACTTVFNTALALSACQGSNVEYHGSLLPAGTIQDFFFLTADGCDSIVKVTVTPLPLSSSQLSLQACPGTPVEYAGSELLPGQTEVFTFQNYLGCDSLVTVSVSALPVNVLAVDGFACEGEFLDYNGTLIPAGGSAVVLQLNADGCYDTAFVGVIPLPASEATLNLVTCWGESAFYLGQELQPGTQTDFILTNQTGCDSIVTVLVSASDPLSFDIVASPACQGGSQGSLQLQHAGGGSPPYLYSLNGQAFQPSAQFQNLPPGEYEVLVQDSKGCEQSIAAEVSAFPPISVQEEPLFLPCDDSLLFTPVVASPLPLTYSWPDGSGDPFFWVTSPGSIELKLSNECETLVRSFVAQPEPLDEDRLIYMPNTFSPNGDNVNDCFRGYLPPDVEVSYFTLRIFDRWGNLLFQTADAQGCWDGTFRGKDLDPGVYTWYLEMGVLYCGAPLVRVFEEGGLHLMR